MNPSPITTTPTAADAAVSRRQLLQGAGALSIAIPLPALAQNAPASATTPTGVPPPSPIGPVAQQRQPSAFLRIGSDGSVAFILPTCEMGQGTHTGQAQILAEELGCNWQRLRVEMPLQPGPDHRLPFGQMRSVGSFGIRFWHDPLRRAAAQARTMLLQAAAAQWNVPVASLSAADGFVSHAASGRRLGFGELAAAAAALPVPMEVTLRPAAERTLTGRAMPRIDTPDKVRGAARFAIDVQLDGLLHGAVRLAPVYTADLADIDESSVRGMPGVVAVARVPRGAVVVAQTWWQAKQAADRLAIRFTKTPHDALDDAEIGRRLAAGLDRAEVPPSVQRGDAAAAFANAAQVVQADYEVPMLAHVCMEPIVGTARASTDKLEIWLGTQGHDVVRAACERASGLAASQIDIHTTYLGGGFGRKTHAEIAVQAYNASRAVGGRPVKVMWSRSDDIQQGQYRQPMAARMRAALDAQGRITAMRVRVSGPQMGRAYGVDPDQYAQQQGYLRNVDPFSLNGLVDMRYTFAALEIEHAVVDVPIPLCPWRSIANSFTGFFLEAFIDECAAVARQDPLAYRLAHLQGEAPQQARMRAVLERVARMARWQQPAPAGVHRGLAVVDSYGSPVAEVVELRLQDGRPNVERVHVAIDCGRAVNPGQVRQQMHGSVVEALGAALRGRIRIEQGRATNSNFGDYPIPRIGEVPQVNTEIVEIGSPLGGVGEPGVPPLAPALVNAMRAAGAVPLRRLPVVS
jgi:isoquinoline 1-oxidoreductase subunit beta